MLTEVKGQVRVTCKAAKYSLMREMLNKTSFIMNIVFMILNNASFLIQWVVLYSIKDNVGGYTFEQILLLWGMAAATYGGAHLFFKKAFSISDVIINGKLDAYLVQPKNVLIGVVTSEIEVSAIGDILYAYIVMCISGFTFLKFTLFTLFMIFGGLIIVSIAIILGSLSFWFGRTDMIADAGNALMTNFATYPDGIFKGVIKMILFTLIPVGFTTYIPVWVLTEFNLKQMLAVICISIISVILAFIVFYRGLKKYSSSNLMISKI